MALSGGLSTSEKLASQNPAVRREGQRELSSQSSSQQKKTVSQAKTISSSGYSGTTTTEVVEKETSSIVPKSYWGTSSAEYGQVSETGKVEYTPEQLSRGEGGARVSQQQEQLKKEAILSQQQLQTSQAKEFSGVYSAAPKPTGILERAYSWLQQRRPQTEEKTYLEGVKGAAIAAGISTVGTGIFGYQLLTKPQETIKKTAVGIKDVTIKIFKGETFPELGRTIKQEPGFALGYVVAEYAQAKALGVAAKKQPLKIRVVKAPVEKPKLFQGVTLEAGSKSQPLVGFSQGRVVLGTPEAELKGLTGEFVPESSTATKILKKSAKTQLSASEAKKIELAPKLLRKTKTTATKFKGELPKRTARLSEKGTLEVLGFVKKEKGKVFGSFPQQAQVPKKLQRVPVDIDIKLPLTAEEIPGKAEKLATKLQNKGIKARVSQEIPGAIEVLSGKKYAKAVELKPTEGILTGESVAPESALGFKLTQSPTKIEGVKVSRLSEQGLRKGASIFTLRIVEGEPKFFPKSYRTKDIADFFAVQETLAKSKLFQKGSTLKKVEELKALYPEELTAQKSKILLADFTGEKISKKGSPKIPSPSSTSPKLIKPSSPNIYPGSPSRSPSPRPSRSLSPPSPSKVLSKSPGRPSRSSSPRPSRSLSPPPPSIKIKISTSPPPPPPSIKIKIPTSPPPPPPSIKIKIPTSPPPPPFSNNKKNMPFSPIKKGKKKFPGSSYVYTLFGSGLPKIKAVKSLGKQVYSGILPRPQVKFK